MIRIPRNLRVPASLGMPIATLGTFDGVHRGHQRVLSDLRRWAARLGASSLVITFDRSPKELVRRTPAPCITSLEHRLVLFERLEIDAAVVLPFDRSLSRMTARQFIEDIVIGKLRAQGVLLGFNCRFGRDAGGDINLLRQLEAEGLVKARASRPVLVGGQPVSSSAIRTAVESGDLRRASRMLGRPVSLLGTVVRGQRRGRRLGYPTANLDLHHEVKPPAGVYATSALIDGNWLPSLTSIGRQTTFAHPPREDVVEVHIPGVKERLYGRDLEIRFVKKLREQVKFPTAEALAEQMAIDKKTLESIRRKT
jgi:riboflavin kinase / FMN adenylyltransferase